MYLNILIFIATLYVVNASVVMIKDNYDAAKADNIWSHSRPMMPPRCTDRVCGLFCDLAGFDNGACLDGQCKCVPKKGSSNAENTDNGDAKLVMKREVEDILVEDEESYPAPNEYSILDNIYEKCNEICNMVCHFLHFEGGSCGSGRCQCSKKDSSTNDEAATDEIDDTNLITEQENKE